MTAENTTPDNLDAVLRRVAKLLAIAQDGRADANEAAAAAEMAEKVMRKYQIDHADVMVAKLKSADADAFGQSDVGSTLDVEGKSKTASGWAGHLAVYVADFHDCQVRYTRTNEHGKTLRFQGFAADAQMARFTYVFLVTQMVHAQSQYLRQNSLSRTEAAAFRDGFVDAVEAKLKQATADKRAEMQAAVTSRGLMVVKANAIAARYGAVKYGKSAGHRRGGEAYLDGHARGSNVDVGRRGVNANASNGEIAA